MPNYAAFNTNPDDLRTLIFGKDGTTTRALAVDAGGLMLVGGATISGGTLAAVQSATVAGGTLDAVLGATISGGTLAAVQSATIAGGTLSAVLGATISGGTLDAFLSGTITSVSQKTFLEIATTDVVTGDSFTALPALTTAVLGTYSFFVYNRGPGTNAADVQIEISANGTNWFVDVATASPIAVGSVDVLVPKRFLKYTRLSYRSSVSGQPTTLDIYFNAQGT